MSRLSPPSAKVLLALPLVLLLAACEGDHDRPVADPHDTAPPEAPPPTKAEVAAPPDAPSPNASCSGADARFELRPQPELPAGVAATREAIYRAATACDYPALDELAPADLRFSFGDPGDALESWKDSEARGQAVLQAMAEVLTLTPERQDDLWVWPAFFIRPVEEWSESDHREAVLLLGAERAAAEVSYGAYLGYRVGIASDGTWRYFIAGD